MKEMKFKHPLFFFLYAVISKTPSFSTYMECCYEKCQSQKVEVSIDKNSFYFICILFRKSYKKEQVIIQEVVDS